MNNVIRVIIDKKAKIFHLFIPQTLIPSKNVAKVGNYFDTIVCKCIKFSCQSGCRRLEWVSYGKVNTHSVLESRNIVISLFTSFIRNVKGDSEVQTQDEEGEVVA